MRIAVASGKGGTGKTTVAVNLALSLEGKVCLADCDVEEPNDHLFLDIETPNQEPVTIPVPEIDQSACTSCRVCVESCEFNALAMVADNVLVFNHLCHGCGACSLFCPEKAITEKQKEIGSIKTGGKGDFSFIYGMLTIGEALAPPIIKHVQAKIKPDTLCIIDSPPGTTCSMVQAVSNSDYCILVAENTPFGFHDAKLAIDAVKDLDVPLGVVINKSDSGSSELEPFLEKEGIPVLLRIPFNEDIAKAYSKGVPFVKELPEMRDTMIGLFYTIQERIS